MRSGLWALILRRSIIGVLLMGSSGALAQGPPPPKTIPDSVNFIWKSVEQEFTTLAEAMPEDK